MQFYKEVSSSFTTLSVLSKGTEQLFSSKRLFRTTTTIVKLAKKSLTGNGACYEYMVLPFKHVGVVP